MGNEELTEKVNKLIGKFNAMNIMAKEVGDSIQETLQAAFALLKEKDERIKELEGKKKIEKQE